MLTDFNTVRISTEHGIAELVLNRPEKRNAISHEMQTEIDLALDELEIDPDVGVVILRGEGEIFSAGHDMTEEYAGRSFPALVYPNARPSIDPRLPRAWYFRKPLIGAVHGYSGPYATAILACCDFDIAAEDTRFSFEVYKGGSPGVPFLPLYLQFPMRIIEKLFLMGGWMSTDIALQFQFVQRVLPETEVLNETKRWAEQLLRIDPATFTFGKERIRRSVEVLGLSALSAVLLPYGPAPADLSEIIAIAAEKGVGAAVRERDKGFDSTISRI